MYKNEFWLRLYLHLRVDKRESLFHLPQLLLDHALPLLPAPKIATQVMVVRHPSPSPHKTAVERIIIVD
jgi:hypothetical protein